MDKLRVLSLFSGIGAFEKALERLNIEHEVVGFSEINPAAIQSYCAIHGVSEDLNLGDVSEISEANVPDCDLMTWGFPCTDISINGKQKGFVDEDGNVTRSGLYKEGYRILKAKRPKYSIIENVKALTHKKFENEFKQILKDLDELGYDSYWKVLDAKDYGVPQQRRRVFIVSIRKDIATEMFMFPEPRPLDLTLPDLLEPNDKVSAKYHISEKGVNYIQNEYRIRKRITQVNGEVALCMTAVGNSNWTGDFVRVGDTGLRKLTPLECYRLMGFDTADYYKATQKKISDAQLYKQAGNSIVVPVLEGIFKNLLLKD